MPADTSTVARLAQARPPLALNTRQVAAELGCSYGTAKELIRKGAIPSFKMLSCRRVRYVDLKAYIDGLVDAA